MTLTRFAIPLVGLAALSAGFAVNSGMSHPVSEPSKVALRLDAKTEAALETLHQELQRRFHDRDDVEFGFSRIARPKARAHRWAPLMSKGGMMAVPKPDEVRKVPGKEPGWFDYEVKDPELGWVNTEKLRPAMRAENAREKEAIDTLYGSKVDVAIYTFGFLGQDAFPPRAKGPGYLGQKSAEAPKAESLLKAVQQAWRSGNADTVVEGPNGWYLMAHRVKADTEACINCHSHPERPLTLAASVPPSERPKYAKRPLYKIGEDLGMVIIAVRPR
jgi:hypothetical protein